MLDATPVDAAAGYLILLWWICFSVLVSYTASTLRLLAQLFGHHSDTRLAVDTQRRYFKGLEQYQPNERRRRAAKEPQKPHTKSARCALYHALAGVTGVGDDQAEHLSRGSPATRTAAAPRRELGARA